jgi:ERO1-like protein alpha
MSRGNLEDKGLEEDGGNIRKRSNNNRKKAAIMVGFLVLAVAMAMASYRHPRSSMKDLVLPSHLPGHSSSSCGCQRSAEFQGVVEDCCCDYETVDLLNKEVLNPVLQELVKKPFFRYYKVKLWCDCPFWPDDGMCQLRDCSVCECPDNEFPAAFKVWSSDHTVCQEGKPEGTVDRTVDSKAFQGWTDTDNPWTVDDETDPADLTYVNLLLNPERYTGYKGESARRIWEAIYAENCFENGEKDACAEKRVFYRLISGLHTSISTHIAADYLIDEINMKWGKNPALLHERVLMHPERVQNLYFTYLFVLRALSKAEAYLSHAEYATGNDSEDEITLKLVTALVGSERLRTACPIPFDEEQMWRGPDAIELKRQLQVHFRNITAIMDCVGCEKCRLWGKLQISGLGAALKILFSEDHTIDLQRNEVIALVNLLSRLSESLELIHEMAHMVRDQSRFSTTIDTGSALPNQSKSRWFLQEGDRPPRSLPSLFQNFGF